MNKKISLGLAISLILIRATASFAVTMTYSQRIYNRLIPSFSSRTAMYSAIAELDELIRREYYGEIDQNSLNAKLADGYIRGLGDSSSFYMTAPQYLEYSDRILGKLPGVGITVEPNPLTGFLTVTEVFPDSPAATEGLEKFDEIIKIGKDAVTKENSAAMAGKLSGKELSSVNLTYRRGGNDKAISVLIGYEAKSVAYELVGDFGYVKITAFYENTLEQFDKAIAELLKQGAKSFIFDVRNTTEGTIEYAAEVIDRLVPSPTEGEQALAKAYDKNGKVIETYQSDANDMTQKMVVLINAKTAGAAELFACDLRDFGKANLIGGKTKGNGRLQKVFPLDDGSAVMLTVAVLSPYSGDIYDGKGVKPDFEASLTAEQEKNPGMPRLEDDAQFQKACLQLSEG